MRVTTLILFSIALMGDLAIAQNQPPAKSSAESPRPETSDEIIVRGRRLGDLRLQVQSAREHAFDIFNEINSNDDFDVRCVDETRTFSHAKRRICRARFENRIAAQAGKDYLQGLLMICRGIDGVSQDCMFSAAAERGTVRAQSAETPLMGKHQQMNDEILRLANENPRFAQAILDYYKLNQELQKASKRGGD